MSNAFALRGRPPVHAPARRWPRYKVEVPIRVIVTKAGQAKIFAARSTCLSEGGMGMFAGAELDLGDQVAVEFTHPYGTPIRVDARICNRTGYTYGVEFLTDSGTRKEGIAQFRMHLSSLTASAET
jgi:hypothetical protein